MLAPGWWAGAEASSVMDAVSGGFPGWIPDIGSGVLLAFTVYLILTGRLVPVSTVRRIEADRDRYRDAGEVKDQTIARLAESGQATLDFIKALDAKLGSQKDATP